jgi:hypothetical protein
MINKLKNLTPKILGHIGVDAGIVWIGDPCYIMHREERGLPSTVGKNWHEFCDKLGDDFSTSFNYEAGHEGLGVCTSTYWGDGTYPVIGFFEKEGRGSVRPVCIMVDFYGIYSEDEEDEEDDVETPDNEDDEK